MPTRATGTAGQNNHYVVTVTVTAPVSDSDTCKPLSHGHGVALRDPAARPRAGTCRREVAASVCLRSLMMGCLRMLNLARYRELGAPHRLRAKRDGCFRVILN